MYSVFSTIIAAPLITGKLFLLFLTDTKNQTPCHIKYKVQLRCHGTKNYFNDNFGKPGIEEKL